MTADACRCKRPGCPAGPNFPTQMLFQFSSARLGARDVTIVRGQQGTAEWQQHRCGKIGGSMAYACAHATAHNRKVNLCAQLCQCVKRSAPTDAMRWGTNHEKAALLQYMICMTITGQAVEYYTGPFTRCDRSFWKDKKWQQHLQCDQQSTQVYTPLARVDGDIQVGAGAVTSI